MPATFWLIAAGVSLPAVVILLWPFRRRADKAGDKADDKGRASVAVSAAVILVAGGVLAYYPRAFNYEVASAVREMDEQFQAEYAARVAELRAVLSEDADAVDAWRALAETHAEAGRPALAASAYAELERRRELSPDERYSYAEAILIGRESEGLGEARRLLDSILVDDTTVARHQLLAALWLSGVVYGDLGRHAEAARDWRRLLGMLPEDADAGVRARLVDGIEKLERRAESGGASVEVLVEVAADLKGRVGADDVLMVYAKAVDGPPAPVAVVRVPAGEWPATVTLDRAAAMVEELSLDAFDEVVVTARISKTGTAALQSGDLFGESEALSASETASLSIEINRVAP